ncbi:hypothetical protein [uncultured Chitinophaga sp.]|uniref:hypothetical protein n=1 Tax=uncultured Chitinophaga sp. TaxID=339340 RepID=UPI0025FD1DF6|nr:hypothetical protein [uncultured Chitinophaga sp.]
MLERDYRLQQINELIEELKRDWTPERGLASLQRAGIIDDEGYMTEPYQHIGWFFGREARPSY